jgi:hypothetical protein
MFPALLARSTVVAPSRPNAKRALFNIGLLWNCQISTAKVTGPFAQTEPPTAKRARVSATGAGGNSLKCYGLNLPSVFWFNGPLDLRYLGRSDKTTREPSDRETVRPHNQKKLERRSCSSIIRRCLSQFMHRFLRPLCDKPVSNDRTVVRSALIVQDKTRSSRG